MVEVVADSSAGQCLALPQRVNTIAVLKLGNRSTVVAVVFPGCTAAIVPNL